MGFLPLRCRHTFRTLQEREGVCVRVTDRERGCVCVPDRKRERGYEVYVVSLCAYHAHDTNTLHTHKHSAHTQPQSQYSDSDSDNDSRSRSRSHSHSHNHTATATATNAPVSLASLTWFDRISFFFWFGSKHVRKRL